MVEYPGQHRRPSVFIANDQQENRAPLKAALEGEGIRVVAEAETAWRLSSSWGARPGVVLMDLPMTVMGGIEATRLITQETSGIPVIAPLSALCKVGMEGWEKDLGIRTGGGEGR